jgi:phospholipid/cholesterol/gamma-HCH transport system substrate-binding protein
MVKQAPSFGRLLIMVGFAFSCVAILLYLWLTFGGAVPLRAKGYRVNVDFPEATTLADQADVRISGVNVGKVIKKQVVVVHGQVKPLTEVTLEINHKYAPIPKDTRAILRQKTLLGETYVELSPGNRGPNNSNTIFDGGSLPNGQVAQTVQLDEIFRTFDPTTRMAFQTWMQQQGVALGDRGQDLNDALGDLTPFADNTDKLLQVLNNQSVATSKLVRNTAVVFNALTARDGQLSQLISNSNRVFQTTAARDQQLAAAFRAFPAFEDESRAVSVRLTRFANNTNPLIDQLRPAARQLSPTLITASRLAPNLKGLFEDLDPLVKVSKKGLPAVGGFLDQTRPVLAQVDPFLREVNPILDWLGLYKHEITAFFANSSAATEATTAVDPNNPSGAQAHYLRTSNPVNVENFGSAPERSASNRSNPYTAPLAFTKLATGLEVFNSAMCTSNPVPQVVNTQDPNNPGVGPATPLLAQSTFDLIQQFVYQNQPASALPRPACKVQAPLGNLIGQPGAYPHVNQAAP